MIIVDELASILQRIKTKTATLDDLYRMDELFQKSKSEAVQKNGGTGVCWYCRGRLCWDTDYDYDEVYEEGEGIVTVLHCLDCGAEAQFSMCSDKNE